VAVVAILPFRDSPASLCLVALRLHRAVSMDDHRKRVKARRPGAAARHVLYRIAHRKRPAEQNSDDGSSVQGQARKRSDVHLADGANPAAEANRVCLNLSLQHRFISFCGLFAY
jgi:hypothetical protein